MTNYTWELKKIIPILNKKGFWDTLYILTISENYSISYGEFNQKLNEFSYYNSFLRIKDILIMKGIIKFDRANGKRTITLTEKGIEIHKRLLEIKNIFYRN